MHICIISPISLADRTNWGGIHTHTQMLTSMLKKLGTEVSLITPGSSGTNEKSSMDGVRTVTCPGIIHKAIDKVWIKKFCEAFLKIHEHQPVDCLFSEDYWSYGLHKELVPLKIPIVTFVHNFSLTHFYNCSREITGPRSMADYMLRTVPRLMLTIFRYELPFYRSSRYVLPVSAFNARLLRRYYRLPKDKIRVLHNWVDTETFAPNESRRREARFEHHVPDKNMVFLLVGSLWRPKGFHLAIRAFDHVIRSIPNSWLLIAGGEKNDDYLTRHGIDNEETKRKLVFLGHQDHDRLPSLYNAADIFLMPSLLSEGCPYSLLEAMSSGLPIIAGNIGGNAEMLSKAGILVRPDGRAFANAMKVLASSPDKRLAFSKAARQRALDLFSEEAALENVSAILRSLTG